MSKFQDGRFTDEMLAQITKLLQGKKCQVNLVSTPKKNKFIDDRRSRSTLQSNTQTEFYSSSRMEVDLAGLDR